MAGLKLWHPMIAPTLAVSLFVVLGCADKKDEAPPSGDPKPGAENGELQPAGSKGDAKPSVAKGEQNPPAPEDAAADAKQKSVSKTAKEFLAAFKAKELVTVVKPTAVPFLLGTENEPIRIEKGEELIAALRKLVLEWPKPDEVPTDVVAVRLWERDFPGLSEFDKKRFQPQVDVAGKAGYRVLTGIPQAGGGSVTSKTVVLVKFAGGKHRIVGFIQ